MILPLLTLKGKHQLKHKDKRMLMLFLRKVRGLVNLYQLSVTTNPLPTHYTHMVAPFSTNIHFVDLIEDDNNIHMIILENTKLKFIVFDEILV